MIKFIPLASSSKGNAYLLQADGTQPFLLEAGLPIGRLRDKLREHEVVISDLAGCLVSHEHMDHAKAVKDLIIKGVDCWMSRGTSEALDIDGHYRVHPLFTNMTEGLPGQWRVQAFPLEHDAKQPVGFFIAQGNECLLFIPDTAFAIDRFANVTMLAVECNYISELLTKNIQEEYIPAVVGKRVRRNHMSLENLVQMLRANDLSKCRELWLLHLSDGNSDERCMRKEIQEATGIPVYVANAC